MSKHDDVFEGSLVSLSSCARPWLSRCLTFNCCSTLPTEVNCWFFYAGNSDMYGFYGTSELTRKKSGWQIDGHAACVCTCFNISSGIYYLPFLVYSYAAPVLNPLSKPGWWASCICTMVSKWITSNNPHQCLSDDNKPPVSTGKSTQSQIGWSLEITCLIILLVPSKVWTQPWTRCASKCHGTPLNQFIYGVI